MLVILGHPYENRFNAAIACTAKETLESKGHIVMFHDLYSEDFNSRIPKINLTYDTMDDELIVLHQRGIRILPR